jgi:hypothetical protein
MEQQRILELPLNYGRNVSDLVAMIGAQLSQFRKTPHPLEVCRARRHLPLLVAAERCELFIGWSVAYERL